MPMMPDETRNPDDFAVVGPVASSRLPVLLRRIRRMLGLRIRQLAVGCGSGGAEGCGGPDGGSLRGNGLDRAWDGQLCTQSIGGMFRSMFTEKVVTKLDQIHVRSGDRPHRSMSCGLQQPAGLIIAGQHIIRQLLLRPRPAA
jgi:hypothetical protein